jgi:hypothetical protein
MHNYDKKLPFETAYQATVEKWTQDKVDKLTDFEKEVYYAIKTLIRYGLVRL